MENIEDIISNLSADDIKILKGVASSILGSSGENSAHQNTKTDGTTQKAVLSAGADTTTNTGTDLNLDMIDFDMIIKAKSLFDKMNNSGSKNAELIKALKPHLSQSKQDKAEQAIKMLKLFEILPLLKELF